MEKNIYMIKKRLKRLRNENWQLKKIKNDSVLCKGKEIVMNFKNQYHVVTKFMEHAPKDIQFLLKEIERLKQEKRDAYVMGYSMAKFDTGMDLKMLDSIPENYGDELIDMSIRISDNHKKRKKRTS